MEPLERIGQSVTGVWQEAARANARLDAQEEWHRSAAQRIHEIGTELATERARIDQHQNDLAVAGEVPPMRTALTAASERIAALEARLTEVNARLDARLTGTTARAEAAEQSAAELTDRMTALEQYVRKVVAESAEHRRTTQWNITQLSENFTTLTSEISKLTSEQSAASAKMSSLYDRDEWLRGAHREMTAKFTRKTTELTKRLDRQDQLDQARDESVDGRLDAQEAAVAKLSESVSGRLDGHDKWLTYQDERLAAHADRLADQSQQVAASATELAEQARQLVELADAAEAAHAQQREHAERLSVADANLNRMRTDQGVDSERLIGLGRVMRKHGDHIATLAEQQRELAAQLEAATTLRKLLGSAEHPLDLEMLDLPAGDGSDDEDADRPDPVVRQARAAAALAEGGPIARHGTSEPAPAAEDATTEEPGDMARVDDDQSNTEPSNTGPSTPGSSNVEPGKAGSVSPGSAGSVADDSRSDNTHPDDVMPDSGMLNNVRAADVLPADGSTGDGEPGVTPPTDGAEDADTVEVNAGDKALDGTSAPGADPAVDTAEGVVPPVPAESAHVESAHVEPAPVEPAVAEAEGGTPQAKPPVNAVAESVEGGDETIDLRTVGVNGIRVHGPASGPDPADDQASAPPVPANDPGESAQPVPVIEIGASPAGAVDSGDGLEGGEGAESGEAEHPAVPEQQQRGRRKKRRRGDVDSGLSWLLGR